MWPHIATDIETNYALDKLGFSLTTLEVKVGQLTVRINPKKA
jgi:hypothetical protein